jgi:putative sugar O-methyltransferase
MDLPERLQAMLDGLATAPAEVLPSRYWTELNQRNLRQLGESGYDAFKRTLARNYFTWVVSPGDSQLRFLRRELPTSRTLRAAVKALLLPRQVPLTRKQTMEYAFLTHLLWDYVAGQDREGLLAQLDEPRVGNPPDLQDGGRLISQDLANAVLEYRSMTEAPVDASRIRTVLELGAGYGRNAYVFLKLNAGVRYRIADIPPALYVAERYLSEVFPQSAVFRYRPFDDYASVRDELESARIAFLLPQQLDLLPARSVDLFVNISSLHEMRIEQIRYYFERIDRLTAGFFYTKQWRESRIPHDDVVIREDDYPVQPRWRRVYNRACQVQDRFFEALFDLSPPP